MGQRIGTIRVGTVKIGDTLHGCVITGFGQSWIVSDEDNAAFGAGPGERVRVCYAYGERVAAPSVAVAPLSRADEIRAQIRRNASQMEIVGARARRDLTWKNAALERELESLTA